MIIVSFATRDRTYQKYAKSLIDDAERCGLTLDMRDTPRGSLKEINLRKPGFLLAMMDLYRNDAVVWCDADSHLVDSFELPAGNWDIGLLPHYNPRLAKKNPMCAHFIAARPTKEAKHFLTVWAYLCNWPGLTKYHDHKRLTWARYMLEGEYEEVDLSDCISGTLVSDRGRSKEHKW